MWGRLRNRTEAGRRLADALQDYRGRKDVLVLALPRGGVPVALEIARDLRAPLDVCLVRKLGVPWHPELAMGAIASGGVQVLNQDVLEELGIGKAEVEAVARRERAELARREAVYRAGRPPLDLAGRTLILVDDGVATGATMLAALQALRQGAPAALVVAVPVADPGILGALRARAEDVLCLLAPHPLGAIGRWYDDFSQTTDEEVAQALAEAGSWSA